MKRGLLFVLLVGLVLVIAGCAQSGAGSSPAVQATAAPPAQATSTPASAATPAGYAGAGADATPAGAAPAAAPATPGTAPITSPAGGTVPGQAAETGALRFVVAPGTEARYRVKEQLANRNLPSDAIGKTQSVTGLIAVNPDGSFVRGESKISVDLATLRSDESRRDNFIGRNTLQTSQYPTVEFVPTQATGLPSPFPDSGSGTFELTGDLTIHGVTKPVTWQVKAQRTGQELTGTATTSFKFEDFGMTPPKVFLVLSVEDNIRLELDLKLTQQP